MQKTVIANANREVSEVENGGLVVTTQERRSYRSVITPLVNDNGSPFLNVDGSAGGASDGIHDGTDSVLWTASALSGTWDFASTAQAKAGTKSIDATATSNGDQALLTRSSAIAAGTYLVFTGSIYLTRYNDVNNEITFLLRLAGVIDGAEVNIGDYIDGSTLNVWQDFAIPLSVAGATGDIDEMVIKTVNTGGPTQDYYLDELKFQESGALTYHTNLSAGQVVQYKRVDFIITDNVTSIVTVAGATENATGFGISYNAILGVPLLGVGINFRRVNNNEVLSSGNISSIGDMITAGSLIVNQLSDGTNTMLKLSNPLEEWVTLDESKGDALEVVINDDLSGLLDFKVFIIGREVL